MHEMVLVEVFQALQRVKRDVGNGLLYQGLVVAVVNIRNGTTFRSTIQTRQDEKDSPDKPPQYSIAIHMVFFLINEPK